MKTNILPVATLAAASLAILILPISPEAAGILVAVPGFISLFVLEYSRSLEPLRHPAEIKPFEPAGSAQGRTLDAA
jgi:hypothetical protein